MDLKAKLKSIEALAKKAKRIGAEAAKQATKFGNKPPAGVAEANKAREIFKHSKELQVKASKVTLSNGKQAIGSGLAKTAEQIARASCKRRFHCSVLWNFNCMGCE